MRSINSLVIMVLFAFLPFSLELNGTVLNSFSSKVKLGGVQNINQNICEPRVEKNELKDCTITIKNEDGTSLEVTFHDITWFQCAKIKIGKWIKDTF